MSHHPVVKLPVSEKDEKRAIDTMTDRFRDIVTLLGEDVQREGPKPVLFQEGRLFLTNLGPIVYSLIKL